jgi:hypothetical protein
LKILWELKQYSLLERRVWAKRNLKKKGNTAKEQDDALDAGLTELLFDVTIYIYVGDALEK